MTANPHIFLQTAYQHVFTNLSLVSHTTVCLYPSLKENCVNATELPFNTLRNFVCCLAIYRLCSQIFFGWTKLWEKSPFVQTNYRSICRDISCKLWSELSSKNHGNKEWNLRISLALLLHNTVGTGCFGFIWTVMHNAQTRSSPSSRCCLFSLKSFMHCSPTASYSTKSIQKHFLYVARLCDATCSRNSSA